MADRNLTLGTIFEGRMDASFMTATRRLRTVLTELNKAMGRTSGEAKKAEKSTTGLGSAQASAAKKAKSHSQALEFQNKQIRRIHGVYAQLMGAMRVTVSYGIAGAAIYNLVQAFRAGIAEIGLYDQALKNLQAITGATDAQVALMGETIKDVARTTKFSTSEVADGMVLLGQAGFSASESIEAMQATADLATGTLSNMELTTDLMTTTIRAFGLQAIEAGRVSDVMANAINRSKLTIDKLRIAFNFVGAAAAQTGLSLEETAASMMVLANNGLRASTIGTGLRQVLSRLLAPNRKLREAFEEHGIELAKVNPKLVGFGKSLANLAPLIWDNEKQVVDMGKAYQLFGLRGAQAAAVIIRSYMSGDYQRMLDRTYETGTAAGMAAKQAEGLGIKFKNLADRAKLVAVALGEAGIADALGFLIDALRNALSWLEEFVQTGFGKLIFQVGLLSAALYGLVAVWKTLIALPIVSTIVAIFTRFGILAGLVSTVTMAFQFLGNVLYALFLTPLGAGIAIVTGLTIGLYRLITAQRRAADSSKEMATEARSTANAMSSFRNILGSMEEGSREYESTLRRFIDEHPELAREVARLTGVVKLSSLSYVELSEAMKKVEAKNRAKSLEGYTDALIYHAKKAEEVREEYDRLKEAYFLSDAQLSDFIEKKKEAGGVLSEFEDVTRDVISTLTDQVVEQEKTTKEAENYIDVLKKMGSISADVAKEMKEQLRFELEKIAEQQNRTRKEMEKFVDELPDDYRVFYEKLDIMRQADFAKVRDKIDKEIAAYKKRAEILGHTEEDQAAAKAAITARSVANFISEIYKEFESVQENEARKLDVIEEFRKQALDIYRREYEEIIRVYSRRLEDEKLTSEETIRIRQEMHGKLLEAEQRYNAKLRGYNTEANEAYIQSVKEIYEEAVDIAEDHLKDLERRLGKLKDDLVDTLDEIKDAEASYREDVRDIRKKTMTDEQKWLSDREEANRLLREAIAKGDVELAEKASDLFKDLARAVKSESGDVTRTIEDTTYTALDGLKRAHDIRIRILQDETKNITGEIYKTEEAITKFKDKIEEYKEALKGLAESSIVDIDIEKAKQSLADIKSEVEDLKSVLEETDSKELRVNTFLASESVNRILQPLKEVGWQIDSINGKQVTVFFQGTGSETAGLVDKLEQIRIGAENVVSMFQEMAKLWISVLQIKVSGLGLLERAKQYYDSLKDKTVTITIKTVNVSSGGGGGTGTEGGGEVEAGTGAVSSRTGGNIPGFGGGDIVPAWLEPGEFVIRKEAVQKYGENLFQALNNMAFRFGGVVKDYAYRFRVGGGVPRFSAPSLEPAIRLSSGGTTTEGGLVSGRGSNYHFHYSPTVSTASKAEMRQAAAVFFKFIEDKKRRRGNG